MLSYTDPLFGIIIFVSLIATAAFIDYWQNRYKEKKKKPALKTVAYTPHPAHETDS